MIEINNLTTNPVDEEFLRKVVKKVLKKENKEGADLSIALVGQGRMRKLNKKYKRKNRVTDILAFPDKDATHPSPSQPSVGPPGLGEIVICLSEVKKNARRFGLPSQILQGKTWEGEAFEKELATCLIHGILHLLGYNHEKSEMGAEKMRKKEEYYLSKI